MQLNLGTKIRQLRHRDGRTQEALAEALGVTSQAVSRWESGGSYPDMGLLPSIANYFNVTIDELFGYNSERSKKVDMLVSRINDMKHENRGEDINIDECIALAREAMIEFPGNDKIMLCLASVLYKAGGIRYGEHHLIDNDGYNIFDTERHRGYTEWQEAITLYEKVLDTLPAGEARHKAVDELSQLYVNIGEHDKALELAETAPNIWGSKEFLRIYACDGKKQAQAYGEAMLICIHACASLMVNGALAYERNMTPAEKAESIRGAIALFDNVCTDGNYGEHNPFIARMYTLLSLHLWLDSKHDEAFEALDKSFAHFKMFEEFCAREAPVYTAPLIRLVKADFSLERRSNHNDLNSVAAGLAESWPWWDVPEESLVRNEMQADPRWKEWVAKTKV